MEIRDETAVNLLEDITELKEYINNMQSTHLSKYAIGYRMGIVVSTLDKMFEYIESDIKNNNNINKVNE